MRARHALGWLAALVFVVCQPWGRLAADTKLDLIVDPAGFLAGALDAWTDVFTLGQLQNQAYGYLFPQGLFFLLTEPLPDVVAQRAWWLVVLGVGYSGALELARTAGVRGAAAQVGAAAVFALSPRVLTTLTAISSETWPVMLAPWVVLALLRVPTGARSGAVAVLPVALMGAVNATATIAACVPGAVALGWLAARSDRRRAVAKSAAVWAAGSLAVSLWWLVPLFVLGRYSAPFTQFIESAAVTTRWLNPAEVLRGTTSWTPFVDTERLAGHLLVAEPVFVVATLAVAACGLVGLAGARGPGRRLRGLWLVMLAVGVAVLGAAAGPFARPWLDLLDGALAPLRNLHKFDPLVRLPLAVGVGLLLDRLTVPGAARGSRRLAAAGLVAAAVATAAAPAWSGRLLPRGAFDGIPDYWHAAAAAVDELDTRTLVYPPAAFARQSWGWTRDEPLQPLTDSPFAVRDAVPLVGPEAIRGLDGLTAALVSDPEAAAETLTRAGIGAVLLRRDLAEGAAGAPADLAGLGGRVERFGPDGELELHVLDAGAGMRLVDEPTTVAGGGEVLPLLDAAAGPATRRVVGGDAEIVTDTPQLVTRNYGAVRDAVSAPLAGLAEGADVKNRVPDYPSAGPRTRVEERGGHVRASSSAAQATNFGGARPHRSVTAAVDGDPQSAWWPATGGGSGEFIEVDPDDPVSDPQVTVTATADTEVRLSAGSREVTVRLQAATPRTVTVPGAGPVRVELTGPVGIAEVSVAGRPVERVVRVPDTSPAVRAFFFQRLLPDSGPVDRVFTAPRPMRVRLTAASGAEVLVDGRAVAPGQVVSLSGEHRVRTDADWVYLAEEGFDPAGAGEPVGGGGAGSGAPPDVEVAAADHERLLVTGRAANAGLRARIGRTRLAPEVVDAGVQAFRVPAGAAGTVEFAFAGQAAYRAGLAGGGAVAVAGVLVCLWVARRRGGTAAAGGSGDGGRAEFMAVAGAAVLSAGPAGAAAAAAAAVSARFTRLSPRLLAGLGPAAAAVWLARAPWPEPLYAGDHPLTAAAVLFGVCAAALPLEHGPLDKHPAAGGHGQRAEESQRGDGQKTAGKRPDPGQREDHGEHRDVPEEQ